ncbi:MAG: ATP-binding protein [archaeon]|nr:ATP-binding protein [archaeon]
MKEIVVISGKGGTGKTSILASFAVLAERKVICDADVDAPDLHLLLKPEIEEEHDFWGREVAFIEKDKCTECGLCLECRFNAIKDFEVDFFSCEGCRLCFYLCPGNAIEMKPNLAGHWFTSRTKYGLFVHAKLEPGQENSGKLVAEVKQAARKIAERERIELILCDGPPGMGCPVISSLSGASLALLVTEPTLSGIHDLERVLDVCCHFGIPAAVVINKYDLDAGNTFEIERFCAEREVEVLARIPFDNVVPEAIVKGMPVVEYTNTNTNTNTNERVSREIKALWKKLEEGIGASGW